MALVIEMAPMQGFTDHAFRKAYLRFFGGIDRTFSPFILFERGTLRGRDRRELVDGRQEAAEFTPQIAAASIAEANGLRTLLRSEGFDRVNLNLGCPFPMLTKKRRGAGALPHPELVSDLLGALTEGPEPLVVSVKTRLGLHCADELAHIVPVLNRYPLREVIIHPRIAPQKYSGSPDWAAFGEYGRALTAPVIANGDITTVETARALEADYPFISGLMLGRGLLMDPLLPLRIRHRALPESEAEPLKAFHDALYRELAERLSPPHLLHRMTAFWSYFAAAFDGGAKLYKRVKKTKRIELYETIVRDVFLR